MVALKANREARWLDLDGGVRVQVRPCTSAIIALARSRALRRLSEARADPPAGLDLTEPDAAEALTQEFLEIALAQVAITAWENVVDLDADGNATEELAPVTPENVESLMRLWPMGKLFFEKFTVAQAELINEGNGLRPVRDGTSARAAVTVPAAGSSASPAQAEPLATTDSSVRT